MTAKGKELYEYANKLSNEKIYIEIFDNVLTMEAKLENMYQDYQENNINALNRISMVLQENIQLCKAVRKTLSKLMWD